MAAMKGRRNRIKYMLISIIKTMYEEGKYKNKYIVMKENYKKYNMWETHLIHDHRTYTEYKDIAANFAGYLKEYYGVKYELQFMRLTKEELYDYINKYFEYLRNIEKLSQNIIENHISALSKILPPVRQETREFFTIYNKRKPYHL